jgi:hypothetical protein
LFIAWCIYAVGHELIAPAKGGEFPARMNLGGVPPEIQTFRDQAMGLSSSEAGGR